jgi:HAD superfamily hydrolase (TIGR01549 family)
MALTKMKSVNVFGFDLGNTLVNDTKLFNDAAMDMGDWLLKNAHVQSKEAFLTTYTRINHGTKKPFISHTFGELEFFEKTFDELAVTTISAATSLKKYREILMEKILPDKDIMDAFRLIKERNMRIALMSNESSCRVDAYLEKTKLAPFFDAIIVSERIGVEKPDPRFFEKALHQLNIEGDQMVMFGDNEVADGAGKQLGIFFVLVTAYKNKDWIWEDGNPYQPDHVLEKITQKDMAKFLQTNLPPP